MDEKLIVCLLFALFILPFASAFNFGETTSTSSTVLFGNLTNISQMADVNVVTPATGEGLVWNDATGFWENTVFSVVETLWNANYSTFLTHITWANVINGTMMKQADWNSNYTTNNDKWLNTTNDSYYLKSNPFSFYNSTTLPATVETLWNANYSTFLTHIDWSKAINGTLMKSADWNATNTSYYLTSNPNAYYNVTTAPTYINDTFGANYSDYLITKTYASNDTNWNSSGLIKDWNATGYLSDWWGRILNGTMAKTSDLVNYNSSGLIKDWNATGYIANWNASGLIRSWTDTDTFVENYSTFLTHIDWSKAINGTLALSSAIPTNNNQLLNGFNFYNVTTAPIYTNDTFGANYSTYLTLFNWNKTYADTLYFGINNWNSTNESYYLVSNPFGYYNSTNPSPTYNSTYNTWAYNQTTPAINTILGFSYYNLTNAPIYLNDTFRGTNYSDFLVYKNYGFNNTFNYYNVTTAPIYVNDTFGANYSDYLITKTYASNDTDFNSTGYIKNWTVDIYSANTSLKDYIEGKGYLTSFTELDPHWSANYSLYNSSWSSITNTSYALESMLNNGSYFNIPETDALAYNGTLMFASNWNATNTSYALSTTLNNGSYLNVDWNSSGLIKDWNADNYIKDWNASGYIKNWDVNSYIKDWNATGYIKDWAVLDTSTNTSMKSYVDALDTATNTTVVNWVDGLFVRFTELVGQVGNWTLDKPSYMTYANWNATNTSYYLDSNPKNYWNTTFATFNKTYADTLYATWTNVINGTVAKQSTVDTNVTTANLHTHDALNITTPTGLNSKLTLNAENITAGTFGSGTFTMNGNLTLGATTRYITNGTGGASISHNGTGWVIKG